MSLLQLLLSYHVSLALPHYLLLLLRMRSSILWAHCVERSLAFAISQGYFGNFSHDREGEGFNKQKATLTRLHLLLLLR